MSERWYSLVMLLREGYFGWNCSLGEWMLDPIQNEDNQ